MVSETRTQLGTLVTISVVHSDAATAREMVAGGYAEMERLEGLLSRHRPDTPVARLNREGILRNPPAEVMAVARRSAHFHELTEGSFDITVKPMLDLYSASFAATGEPPPESHIGEALALVGFENVLLGENAITFGKPGMSISLDGIAKGYIVDRVVAGLNALGAERVFLDAGGDIGTLGGRSANEDWKIGIQNPRDASSSIESLSLRSGSVATSGDYYRAFTADRRYHHILDPRTGRSPQHTSGVTVAAPSAMDADALSTAVFVMGSKAGLDLLDGVDATEGLVVSGDQQISRSAGW